MKKTLLALMLLSTSLLAFADEQSDCSDAAGTYISGVVVKGPVFARASSTLQGVQLSHTHISVRADQDGRVYDVAIDNVYASDYVLNGRSVPVSFKTFAVNSKVSMCGQTYTSGVGIHWVHNNCGVSPDSAHPDGWIKKLISQGRVSDSYTASQSYCYLWN